MNTITPCGIRIGAVIVLFVLFSFSCSDYENSLDERIRLLKLQSLPEVSYSSNNQYSENKVKLGKLLFYDPILSGEKNIACATCHHPSLGYADAIDLSIGPGGKGLGVKRTRSPGRPYAMRNSPTIVNTTYNGLANASQKLNEFPPPMTWTSIRRTLEAQTLAPITNQAIMRGNIFEASVVLDSISKRLQSIPEYVTLFDREFKGGPGIITPENLGKAVAAFEQSIVSNNSPYDEYVNGQTTALSEQQKAGLLLFFGKANCATCHAGSMFSDYALYNLGIFDNPKLNDPDLGNGMQRLFRTPSLRNVALTAPYMHNGTIATLRDVLRFYNSGGAENPSVAHDQISIKITPLHLSEDEVNSILSFLEALTDETYDREVPLHVPSGLKPGGN
jgi:cytochrome c peroxidase